MKFEYRDGLLYLPISVFYDRSTELIGIVDTGSASTAVEVEEFNVDLLSRGGRMVTRVGVGGFQESFAQTVSQVSIGEFSVENFEIDFCNLKDDFGFSAIIGSDLLDALDAVIDYGKREINFSI